MQNNETIRGNSEEFFKKQEQGAEYLFFLIVTRIQGTVLTYTVKFALETVYNFIHFETMTT